MLHANIPNNKFGQNHSKAIATVETISKQLEYVTKGHIAKQTIFFKFKMALFFSLAICIYVQTNIAIDDLFVHTSVRQLPDALVEVAEYH